MLPAALAFLLVPLAMAGERIEVALPDGVVKASLEVAGFERATETQDSDHLLLNGRIGFDAVLSLDFERNFPFLSSAECAKRYAKFPRYAAFDVDGIACCTWEVSVAGITGPTFLACVTTPDYRFSLHASRMSLSKNKTDVFLRDDFKTLVRTFRCEGRVDAATQKLPATVYAFRDEASAHASEQLVWVEGQSKARPDEWSVHFYFGALGHECGDDARLVRGYERASQLLAAKAERDVKETRALIESYDALGRGYASKKRYRDAIEPLMQLLALVPADAPDDVVAYRTVALYNLARYQAKNGKPDEAMMHLRAALAAQPELKEAAREDELFDSLRSKPEFKKLVAD